MESVFAQFPCVLCIWLWDVSFVCVIRQIRVPVSAPSAKSHVCPAPRGSFYMYRTTVCVPAPPGVFLPDYQLVG